MTRPRPHIDRLASAWLIRRFCDSEAQFAFADAADAARKGIPFDVLGADFGHHGEDRPNYRFARQRVQRELWPGSARGGAPLPS